MPYPGLLTFPSASLFPGAGTTPPTYAQACQVQLGSLVLSARDSNGVDWFPDPLVGWYGSPASTMALTQKPRSFGGWQSVSRQLVSRVIAVTGGVQSPDPASLETAMNQLNAAATLDATTFTVTENGTALLAIVYRQGEVLTQRVTDTFARWSVQLSAPDPRKFVSPVTATTRLPSTSGGLTIPFTIPFTISSTVVSGNCSLTNPGNATGPVQMRIDGPCTGPVVTHVGTGAALVFSSSLVLGAGEFLLIDMEAQSTLAQGQASRNGYITSRGWSGFEPGVNVWSFTAVVPSTSALLTVTASSAWL